jgi:uncharacterized phiE125 gp8 family phage protein
MRQSLVNITALDGDAVLPLDMAKAHLRVLDDDSDELITAFRDAAVDMIEQYAEKALVSRAFKWRGRLAEAMEMGMGPVTAISAVTYLDADGAQQSLVAADTLRVAMADRVEVKTGMALPEMADGDGVAEITFTAGYSDPALPIPASLLAAAKLMLGHLYMNREAVTFGSGPVEIPFGVRQLCGPYRPVRL